MNAVVFDMDGLMFDTERLCIKIWDYAGEKMGIGKAGYMVYKTLGIRADEAVKLMHAELGDYDDKKFNMLCREYRKAYFAVNTVPVKKGLYELLEYLKCHSFKTAVASSTDRNGVLFNLKSAEIENYFDVVVSGEMVEKSKPDPEIYLEACRLLGENPEECFALEDSKNGIISAYNAGCKTVMIPDLWQGDSETDKMLFAKYNDLLFFKKYLESGSKWEKIINLI